METIEIISELLEKMRIDVYKVYENGNHSAAIRARKYAQQIKILINPLRKEIMNEIHRQDDTL